MTAYEETLQLIEKLSLTEKVRLMEELSQAVRHDIALEAYKHIPWDEFIRLTYGSLADDPIERNQPLYPDFRDEIE